jgi:hypothetical protein
MRVCGSEGDRVRVWILELNSTTGKYHIIRTVNMLKWI